MAVDVVVHSFQINFLSETPIIQHYARKNEYQQNRSSAFPTKLSYPYYWSNKQWMMHQELISSQTILQAKFKEKRSLSDLDFFSLGLYNRIKSGPWSVFTLSVLDWIRVHF